MVMNREDVPPSVAILQLLSGKWIARSISAVAKLCIADHLQAGPKTPEELAQATATHAQTIYRVLRALASVGVFAEDERGRFSNTPLSAILATNASGSMRSMALHCAGSTWDAWSKFDFSVQTGKSCFENVHGAGYFDFIQDHPEEAQYFHEAMTAFSIQELRAIHQAFDFSSVNTLVDIAGGHGALLLSSLEKNPKQRGILFEQPQVIDGAKQAIAAARMTARCELMCGDFFKGVPSGADGYMMKHIIHDWDDEHATSILKSIYRATTPGTKLFVIDSVIQSGNEPSFAKLMDLQMLVLYEGGRERTKDEFSSLLVASGFELVRVVPTASTASVIEARRV